MRKIIGSLFVVFTFSFSGFAAIVVFDESDPSAWTVTQDSDAEATFGFDYSPYGIPASPGGGDSKGIRLAVNIEDPGEAAAIAVSPKDFSVSGKYTVSADVWMNFYADPDNSGTTEFAGLFVGFDTVADGTIFGSGVVGDSDGDTSRDFRLYNEGQEIEFASGAYIIPSQNNVDETLFEHFPPTETPDAQLDFDAFDPANEFTETAGGALGFAWHTFVANVDSDAGTVDFSISGLEIGTLDSKFESDVQLTGPIAVALTDIFSSVAPVPEFAFTVIDNVTVETELIGAAGDYDADGDLDEDDVNALINAIRSQSGDASFDANGDGDVDTADLDFWIVDLKNTWFGDANLDGEFNSADFVSVFTTGEYEDETRFNSTWGEGDWNGDGDFSSTDFVKAFSDGGFEIGPRAAAQAVPEPNGSLAFLSTFLAFAYWTRKRR